MDKKLKVSIIGTVAALLVIAVLAGTALVKKYTPNKEMMELSDYYQVSEGEAMIVMNDSIYETNAKIYDGKVYIDLTTVVNRFNKRFYFDDTENILTYTTPNDIIRVGVGSKDYTVNREKKTFAYPVVRRAVDEVYIAIEFVACYSAIEYTIYENPDRVVIISDWTDYLFADVKKNTVIRTEASIKSPGLEKMDVGDTVYIVNNGGDDTSKFLNVMSKDGVFGYIEKKSLGSTYYETLESDYEEPEYTNIKKDDTINLTWHQVTNMEANKGLLNLISSTKGITTISPTWFRVNSAEGTVSSLASETYVSQAHSQDIEVWGLVDNFDPKVDIHEVLAKTSTREKLVNAIMAEAIKYNLDGINIDFENLDVETGPHYIQFLRELSVKCRDNKIVLSSDTYAPYSYTKFYDRAEQGRILDYVVIMGYDEHHSNSEEAGSVSSIGFIRDAIANTLEVVPAEKIIMGIPFYTRLWKEYTELGESKLSSEALSMAQTEQLLKDKKVTPQWDEVTGQDYAEYVSGDSTYKIWIEDTKSIDEKMKLIYDAKLAGVASWRLGFEKSEVWDIIIKYMN